MLNILLCLSIHLTEFVPFNLNRFVRTTDFIYIKIENLQNMQQINLHWTLNALADDCTSFDVFWNVIHPIMTQQNFRIPVGGGENIIIHIYWTYRNFYYAIYNKIASLISSLYKIIDPFLMPFLTYIHECFQFSPIHIYAVRNIICNFHFKMVLNLQMNLWNMQNHQFIFYYRWFSIFL